MMIETSHFFTILNINAFIYYFKLLYSYIISHLKHMKSSIHKPEHQNHAIMFAKVVTTFIVFFGVLSYAIDVSELGVSIVVFG